MRVRLAPPTPRDEFAWLSAVRASGALHRPWVAPAATPAAYRALLARAAEPRGAFHLVRRREDDALVGFANLTEIIRGPLQQAFLGYAAFAGHEGRGYMSEALRLVLREAFSTHRLHRVEANVQPGNTASLALVERVGFAREGFSPRYLKVAGRWRDHERWAITAETWREQRRRAS